MPYPGLKDIRMSFDIRPAVLSDVDAIMAVEKTGISHPWDRASIESLIKDGNKTALVALSGQDVVGYIGASFILDEAEIGNVCVMPGMRGKGTGSALLKSLIEDLESKGVSSIFLEVEDNNTTAISLYTKFGFTKYNMRKDYYGPDRNALLFKRP